MKSLFAALLTLLCLPLVAAVMAEEREDLGKVIRNLAPPAAAVGAADWNKLATSQSGLKVSDYDNQPLAMLIMILPVVEKPSAAQEAEFKTVAAFPKPSEMAGAFQPSKLSLLITPLQFSYIKDVTTKLAGEQVVGEISFEAPKVYTGKFEYTAVRVDDKWQIIEFRLPVRGLKTTLTDGKWKLGEIAK
jgi:hypothetical protein